ncbi:MAG: DUF2795 domain-containing protein [bacterium]|nr:DUF2795 domain-containing protein [bacterium]
MDDVLDSTPEITIDYIESYAVGIRYPVTKEDIIHFAMMNKAENQVLAILQNLEPGVYNDFNEFDFYLRRIHY